MNSINHSTPFESMWGYAVRTVANARHDHGEEAAERKAANWERNCGFDKFKLLKAADALADGKSET